MLLAVSLRFSIVGVYSPVVSDGYTTAIFNSSLVHRFSDGVFR